MSKDIIEGCAVNKLCVDPCKSKHKRVYNPRTKETLQCPAYYKYYMEIRKIESKRGFVRKKREKWVKVELR